MPQGLATGSKQPISSLPASSLNRRTRPGSRSTGRLRGRPGDRLGDDVEMLGRMQRHRDAAGGARCRATTCRRTARPCRRATVPASVSTPAARPLLRPGCSSTRTFSTMRAPRCRAPGASACVVSIGLVWPSFGRKTPPTMSSASISGQRSRIAPGESTSHLQAEALAPSRRRACSSSKRAAVAGDAERAVLLEAGRLAGLGLERAVQLGGVLGELASDCAWRATAPPARPHARWCRR